MAATQAAQPAPLSTISSTKKRKDYRLPDMAALLRPGSEQDFDRDSNTIEVFIGRLRKKIPVDVIQTVRGLGYRMSQGADEV